MKLMTCFMGVWMLGAVGYAIMLLWPFSKTWNCAIGIGLLSNVGFMAAVIYLCRENHALYVQALEATERYIKLAECLRKMQTTGEKND